MPTTRSVTDWSSSSPLTRGGGIAEPRGLSVAHSFDGHEEAVEAPFAAMRLMRTWLAFRREGRGLSLLAVARGWS